MLAHNTTKIMTSLMAPLMAPIMAPLIAPHIMAPLVAPLMAPLITPTEKVLGVDVKSSHGSSHCTSYGSSHAQHPVIRKAHWYVFIFPGGVPPDPP